MARNVQYGRWRKAALTAVLWLVFGASLALAAFISHRRNAALGLALGEPQEFGRLIVRLPKNWQVRREKDPRRAIVAEDYDRQGRFRRAVRITQEQQGPRRKGPEFYLESVLGEKTSLNIPYEFEPFTFLGQSDGVVCAFQGLPSVYRGLDEAVELPDPGVYAANVLPDGLSVTVQVTGPGAFGPTSRQLLREVADGIKLADGAADTTLKH